MGKRRRGTAIIETDKGILLTAMSRGDFLLPGGGADKGESRFSLHYSPKHSIFWYNAV